jgi:septum formation protein
MLLTNLLPYKLILASRSPRRHQLLEGLDIDFEVRLKEDIDETFPEGLKPDEIAIFLSELKAKPFYSEIESGNHIVISADTIVWADNHVLGKPFDFEHAYEMLQKLSGKRHEVYTGISIQAKHRKIRFSDRTSVWFRQLTDDEIKYYLNSYQPFDKAGSYGAQEWIGYTAINKIEGSYFNVMGFPVHRIYEELSQF